MMAEWPTSSTGPSCSGSEATQIERVLEVNNLQIVLSEIVEAARQLAYCVQPIVPSPHATNSCKKIHDK
jgi:hypothetical protein